MVTKKSIHQSADLEISRKLSPIIQNSIKRERVRIQVISQIIRIASRKHGSYAKAIVLLRELKKKYQDVFGEQLLTKVAHINGRYYWRLGTPGFPSPASRRMHDNELNRLLGRKDEQGLCVLFLAITKKCPLQCQHCLEWERLNQPEKLSTADLIQIVKKYQDYGVTQIMLSGGEPMLRLKTVFAILSNAQPTTDFWIISSGLGLSLERAQQLKQAGLTGVMISLDHHQPNPNNQFRGHERAYEWAVNGIQNAKLAGLVPALSLTATLEYTSAFNLSAYMEFGRKLGVAFVQINEIRATGRYRDQTKMLSEGQIQLIEKLYLSYNSDPAFAEFPIINYTGYHQRRLNCFGAGNRFLYIDSDGDVHICPFCDGKICHALAFPVADTIKLLQQQACPVFEPTVIQPPVDIVTLSDT